MRVDQQEGYDAWRVTTRELSSDQEFLVDTVESIADHAEEFMDKNNLTAIESLRQGYSKHQNEVGVLHPNIMARILSIFAIWWTYGEEMVKEATPFESSVIMFGILEYQKELQSAGDDQSDGRSSSESVPEGQPAEE